jgi:hypothetical protein
MVCRLYSLSEGITDTSKEFLLRPDNSRLDISSRFPHLTLADSNLRANRDPDPIPELESGGRTLVSKFALYLLPRVEHRFIIARRHLSFFPGIKHGLCDWRRPCKFIGAFNSTQTQDLVVPDRLAQLWNLSFFQFL